ncbi:MAG: DNA ligase (NAD(+)) LigA, partial [Acidocella sp. 35-58-6]
MKDRLATLLSHIAAANEAYHAKDAPIMSDADYDALRREAADLLASNPELGTATVLEQVGAAPASGFAKITHIVPMLSLDNVFSPEDFTEFCARIRRFLGLDASPLHFVAEPKIDGLSISLTYEHHKFTHAATRGDGTQGEDVTRNLLTMDCFPRKLPPNA